MTEKIIQQNILTRLKSSYINYSMSVIVSRALPDVRDGLKPVHRRVLFAMEKLGCTNTAKYKKSARVVGDVIGKYHPHGDTAAYDTLVRMAQPFSLNAVVIDGQGNFGSIDGDSCAAMRYTECRMSKIGDGCFDDINKDTVDFEDNYDGTEKMPSVLPVRFPQLLVNGSQGIAVGMAANIPSHNPIEALDCISYLLNCELNNETANLEQLMSIMPGPDMATGGIVHGLEDMRDVWMHGRGSFRVMSKWHQEVTDSGKEQIVVTEIPYVIKCMVRPVIATTILVITELVCANVFGVEIRHINVLAPR
ncbi:hypothetical protein I3271_00110 [Photobacterium leiognathi]|uniref:DNA gyrase subunit A n=1 Tax=Photobacterium leiognathi TaxID=553611 RepID=UPI003BF48064|nr:hypothetical protein [Photobacterium leiognathi]